MVKAISPCDDFSKQLRFEGKHLLVMTHDKARFGQMHIFVTGSQHIFVRRLVLLSSA